MRVHLINPSHLSFGAAVATSMAVAFDYRAATPASVDLTLVDETLERADFSAVRTGRCRRHRHPHAQRPARLRSRTAARERGAFVVFGGVHTSLYPDEVLERGEAHAIVKGDGEVVWPGGAWPITPMVVLRRVYEGGRVEGEQFVRAQVGPAAERPLHVRIGSDGARLSEALLVLLGVADRRPATAQRRAPTRSSKRSSSCGASGSASPRWPTTTSIRSRWKTCARRERRKDPARLAELDGDPRGAVRADGAARAAARTT